jgi:branched-chain amino acid transport system ATP-binding protein
MLLEVKNLRVVYGAVHAVNGVSFGVEAGEIVSVIGANGAGKSTIMNAISGLVTPSGGMVRFRGEDITALPPHEIARKGIIQVPEGRGVFAPLTVLENLEVASTARSSRHGLARAIEHVFTLFPRLRERSAQRAGTLSGGEQQMLAFGRALVSDGSILLMDEPSMGLAPSLVEDIFETIRKINGEGKTVLLVEQNANKALEIAGRAYVLETGSIVLSGPAKELRNDPRVKDAYLGG